MHTGRILIIVLLIVSLGGSALAAQNTVFSPPAEKQKTPTAVPVEKKPGVVAVVNGSEISLNDFITELYRAQRQILDGGRPLSASGVTRLSTEVLEALVRQELLYQESRKTVRLTDTEVKDELEKLKGQFQTEADFTKASPSLRPQVERTLSIRKYIDAQYSSKAQVTDTEIRSYYDSHRDALRVPEQVKASYIFVRIDPQGNEAKKTEAKTKIEDARKKVLAGQDFASLAKTYSEDPTASKGGDMGYVRQGQLLKAVEDALFALKVGEVSDVVETRIGYHLVKAMERKPETTVPFENLKDQLRTLIKQEKGQQEANAAIAKVREKAAVQTFLPAEE